MLGLALAGLVGLVLELIDNYMSSPEEVEQVAGVPYIGQIPLLPTMAAFQQGQGEACRLSCRQATLGLCGILPPSARVDHVR